MQIGVFIPIGNNGWLISTTSPQYKPSFDLNSEIVMRGGEVRLRFRAVDDQAARLRRPAATGTTISKSFTLMAGLAAVTTRIELFASVAVLTLPPALSPAWR